MIGLLTASFKSKIRLEAENVVLRRQLIVLRRNVRGRIRLTNSADLAAKLRGTRHLALAVC